MSPSECQERRDLGGEVLKPDRERNSQHSPLLLRANKIVTTHPLWKQGAKPPLRKTQRLSDAEHRAYLSCQEGVPVFDFVPRGMRKSPRTRGAGGVGAENVARRG